MEVQTFTSVQCGVLTISDTRDLVTDQSGALIEQKLKNAGHTCLARIVVKDELREIHTGLTQLKDKGVFCLITNGGTGIARRDVTYEALKDQIQQEIPGFGEIFRMLSFNEIGSRAILSRAFAGFTAENVLLFCLPGSKNACSTAMERLILPELPHVYFERHK
ncbi:molybdenum cofactor biosynthesis protein B [Listeria sp. PSOL-1]|uniref:MogA/MoaB family molybdenum cofactor biosynthesis protein n=1 Tax=Listeria sp. PSOL-1 TaxID=1844999 RepID=UPI0013D8A781|nr:molybdenum cofactor biosynthesis protein B [Listeria sp. PSOL-1]